MVKMKIKVIGSPVEAIGVDIRIGMSKNREKLLKIIKKRRKEI